MAISEEDRRAKLRFIAAFFDDLDKKAGYLEELYRSQHRDEARILCSCYLDWLALALCWPNNQSNFDYVQSLKEYSGKEIFSHIHPKMFVQALNKLSGRSSKWAAIHAKVSDSLRRAEGRLYEEQEIIDLLAPTLEPAEAQDIKRELWRVTFAAIVYDQFRVASVHSFGPPDGTTFDGTTFQGQPVPTIDFFMVYDSLKKIITAAREVSQKTGKWFGHDYK
jgi:hypothetical protein